MDTGGTQLEATLGLECGATRSTAILRLPRQSDQVLSFGPANFALLTRDLLTQYFVNIRDYLEKYSNGVKLTKIGIGMAGILKAEDRQVVKEIVTKVWSDLKTIWVGNDLETSLASLKETDDDDTTLNAIVISGTGSCCYGNNGQLTIRVGGNGHILGDRGSGYALAKTTLRAAFRTYELNGEKSPLLEIFLKGLSCQSIHDLMTKTLAPEFTKDKMASLVPLVMTAWLEGDAQATAAVQCAVDDLVEDVTSLIRKLAIEKEPKLRLGLAGSLLTENEPFRTKFLAELKLNLEQFTNSITVKILRETVTGALKMISEEKFSAESDDKVAELTEQEFRELTLPDRTALSPTESRNPRSMTLDQMPIPVAIDLWLDEEKSIFDKISFNQKEILKRLILIVTEAFKNGGRLFYAGAGTSGRLGVLDASECPPTFQSPPSWVQGIIAGGTDAISNSREFAEDSTLGGQKSVNEHGVTSKDVFIGIASSGTTPFVWGALYQAKALGAFTSFITMNPNLTFKFDLDEVLVLDVGPEILTGSTRLKCGTGTKVILNMITTLAMVQYGKCYENLMVDLDPACEKLRERALRIVLTLLDGTGHEVDPTLVENALVKNHYNIKKTVTALKNAKINLKAKMLT